MAPCRIRINIEYQALTSIIRYFDTDSSETKPSGRNKFPSIAYDRAQEAGHSAIIAKRKPLSDTCPGPGRNAAPRPCQHDRSVSRDQTITSAIMPSRGEPLRNPAAHRREKFPRAFPGAHQLFEFNDFAWLSFEYWLGKQRNGRKKSRRLAF